MGHFRRALGDAPTRHLVVGNCGPAESNQREIEALLAPYGAVLTPGSGHQAFATLPTPQAAAAALEALQGTTHASLPGSGPLAIKFVELERSGEEGGCAEPPLVAVRSAEQCGIPGLACYPGFVSPEEETALLREADAQQHWQLLARRRVLHFGAAFDYETRDVGAPQQPLPPAARRVADRIEQLPGAVAIDQLTVNEYGPGVGIAPHVETHAAFTGAVVSLCLGGPAVMVFRREGHEPRALFLPPRALLVMADEARYAWQHYIPHRKSDLVAPAGGAGEPEVVPRAERRVSFTFRQVRRAPCTCRWPEQCDSQLALLAPSRAALKRMALEQQEQQAEQQRGEPAAAAGGGAMGAGGGCGDGPTSQPPQQVQQPPSDPPAAAANNDAAGAAGAAWADPAADRQLAALESQYVHQVYDAIAPHFAATRFAVWPKVRAFLEALPRGALVADVGCGNGKYFGVRRDGFVLGSDRSAGLARVACRRLQPPPLGDGLRADVAVADGLALPYRPGTCDGVLCIAVLHHIASPQRRLALLAQLLRVLRPGGRALVTVWATEQENMRKVRSWQPVSAPSAAGASDAAAAGQPGGGDGEQGSVEGCDAQQQQQQQPDAAPRGERVASGDYFVPWHLPFHRAESAAAARAAGGAQEAAVAAPAPCGASSSGSSEPAGCDGAPQGAAAAAAVAAAVAAGAPAAAPAPRLDGTKGAVVFQRYYHLFGRGELEGLVAALPSAALVDSFYDKDNWCAVFERTA